MGAARDDGGEAARNTMLRGGPAASALLRAYIVGGSLTRFAPCHTRDSRGLIPSGSGSPHHGVGRVPMRDETIVTVINKSDDAGGNRPKKEACLVVIYGAELGRKYHIDGREMTIGRGTLNDICVSQDSVSRTHATLRVEDAGKRGRVRERTRLRHCRCQMLMRSAESP